MRRLSRRRFAKARSLIERLRIVRDSEQRSNEVFGDLKRALRFEVETCATRAKSIFDSPIDAPLGRLPRAAYDKTAVPMSSEQHMALAAFYGGVDEVNAGLDRAAAANTDAERATERERVRVKALRLLRVDDMTPGQRDRYSDIETSAGTLAKASEYYNKADAALKAHGV